MASVGKFQMLDMPQSFGRKGLLLDDLSVSVFLFLFSLRSAGGGPGASKGLINAVVYLPNCLK